jgi:uncharacterized protein
MQAWGERLSALGPVSFFDYPYQLRGKKSPDRPPVLVAAHRAEFERVRAEQTGPIVLIGKSMGGRIGCHVAAALAADKVAPEARPRALVCLGYPLVAPGGKVRDEVLLELETPVLFVQGTRDSMCPLEKLAAVRARMGAPNELFVVEGGDHSLVVAAGALKKLGLAQSDIDAASFAAVAAFVGRWCS